MKFIWSPKAKLKLVDHLNYLIDQDAPQAARALDTRIHNYVANVLGVFPSSGRYIQSQDLYEAWVSRTKIVLWYRYDGETLKIVDLWHTSQDRSPSDND